jgi:ABC-type phosphate/phosphonate transport system substrate-binding protein
MPDLEFEHDNSQAMFKRLLLITVFLLPAVMFALAICHEDAFGIQEARIGVLAHKGIEQCKQDWQPTMDFLASATDGYRFILVPLEFDKIDNAVKNREVEFIIANSGIYVELEIRHKASRIATMENLAFGKGYTQFGGVIFTRAERNDINSIEDLRGRKFMAANRMSLGGWRTAWGEIKKSGLDPEKDFASLDFAKNHTDVVRAVQKGFVDAGTVRTDTLERMAADKEIDLKAFKVIAYKGTAPEYENFPFALSTPLYPEWPIAKVQHTPDGLAKKVASALLNMPAESAAARSAKIHGWTIPHNYQPVDDLLKYLQIGPYENYGEITLKDILIQRWKTVLVIALFICLMIVITLYVIRLNHRLTVSQNGLNDELTERRRIEAERERLIAELNDALNKVKTLKGLLPICASCKKIRDDKGYWNQIEEYIEDHSDAQFTHGICPECKKKLYPDYFKDK